jgi:hypothetical protein
VRKQFNVCGLLTAAWGKPSPGVLVLSATL